jgi:hypothetical protein
MLSEQFCPDTLHTRCTSPKKNHEKSIRIRYPAPLSQLANNFPSKALVRKSGQVSNQELLEDCLSKDLCMAGPRNCLKCGKL